MAETLLPRRGRVNDNVTSFTNVRTGAGIDNPIAFQMQRGSACLVFAETKGKPTGDPWYKVGQNGRRGFVTARNIDLVLKTGEVNDNVTSFTNVRTGAGTDEPVAFQMQRGSRCTVLGEVKDKVFKGKPWYEVEQDGQTGYAAAHNIDIVPTVMKGPLETGHGKEKASAQGIEPGSDYSTAVTPHITYGEIAMFEDERRFTSQPQCDICLELCLFAERVRSHFGNKPISITSGHRPPAVNSRIGGASNSEHLYGDGQGAIDFFVVGVDIFAVQKYCDENWPYSVGFGAPKGFIHLGLRPGRPRVRWDY